MSQRRKSGWLTKAVKVVASVTAFLAWTGHFVRSADTLDGTGQNIKPPFQLDTDEETGNRWSNVVEDYDVSVDTESFSLQKKHNAESNCDVFYIIVSTIDGKVSALDLQKKGSLVWSVQADGKPLYSSSLANMEMIRNGKKMRLIPSLDGALYQFDGHKVEAIPVSAESLLSSTYKLGDDSMIVGSKDLRNFGVNLHTGKVQFMCGSEGCSNYEGTTENEPLDGSNIVVLTRSTQVVRSVDIKNGNEKWNFSVGQHHVSLPSAARPSDTNDDDNDDDTEGHSIPVFSSFSVDECSGEESNTEDISYENLQLLVPEGRVVALSKADFSQVSWEYKFDSPIAKAWLLRHSKLKTMNLFDGRHVPTLRSYTPEDMENVSLPQPLLYIGSHQKLLYIQASPQLESILKSFTNNRIGHYMEPKVKVSWRPYPNTVSAHAPIFGGNRPQLAQEQHSESSDSKAESTSLTVWHEDYPFDTGYFLYPEIIDTRSALQRDTLLLENIHQKNEEEATLQPVSPWLYWKEVTFVSVVISVFVHVLLSRLLYPSSTLSPEDNACDLSKNSNSSHGMIVSDSTSLFADKISSSGEYISRFATDFDCLRCLGKGGFGIVFEAVNKVDDQHYAVKRTMLPRSEGAKEKLLREVKALAKLEHIGIVRYFNAWVELPPAGWQEERDKLFHFGDTSGPATFSSYPEQCQPAKKQPQIVTGVKGNRKRDNLDAQHLFSGGRSEALLETDSVIFSSHFASSDHQLRQSGSGEFSVHSELSETSDRSEKGFTNSRNNLFSFEMKALGETGDFGCDSIHNSKSSIPFSNYTSTSSGILSHKADNSHRKWSGDSVVFESAGNRPSHSSIAFLETGNSVDDSIVFEKSDDGNSVERSKQGLGLNDQEQHTVDISLSSHESEVKNKDDKPAEKMALPGTKLFLYIQMQLYRKETLKDWLSNNTLNRDRLTILDIFDQIVSAVNYVHSQGLMHRDLKPSNIFFTADGIVKVGDFGLVTELIVQQDQESGTDHNSLGKHTAEVGTTLYMSPEQIARKPYDQKVDIFSLGLIFLELWIPFSTQMERIRTLQDAKRHIFPTRFNKELPSESELVHKMTSADPEARPFTKDILDHPLFQEFAPIRLGARQHKRTVS